MIKLLKNNWWLKLAALAFSTLLWVAITNTTDPEKKFQITDIPIQFINEDSVYNSGMTYYVEGTGTASVELNVRSSDFKYISASDFRAVADLSRRYGETGYVEIDIEVVNNKKRIEGKFKQLTYAVYIRTEEIKTQTFKLEPMIYGSVGDGYSFNEIRLNPDSIDITAPESVLNSIGGIQVPIQLSGETETISMNSPFVIYGVDGGAIDLSDTEHVEISASEVYIEIPVLKLDTIPVIVEVSGIDEVANGYRYISYESDVKSVEISGMKAVVDSISNIIINGEKVSVAGAEGDMTVTVDLNDYLPSGAYVNDVNSMANITFKIEKLAQREFLIDYSDIMIVGKRDNFEYTITGNGKVPVKVIGLSSDLSELNDKDISLSINVADFSAGDYIVALSAGELEACEVVVLGAVTVKIVSVENSSSAAEETTTQEAQTSSAETEHSTESESTNESTEESTSISSGEE